VVLEDEVVLVEVVLVPEPTVRGQGALALGQGALVLAAGK
jgi:hypothetical protein